jgi:hypothetical protein
VATHGKYGRPFTTFSFERDGPLHDTVLGEARARMGGAQQLDEGVAGGRSGSLLAGRASRNVGLDGRMGLLTEGTQGERCQLLGAGMSFGDRHQASPWAGPTNARH